MKFYKIIFLAMTVLFSSLCTFAQTFDTVLSGFVTDELGSVINDAKVILTNRNGTQFSILTNNIGEFKSKLTQGLYKIEVIRIPYSRFIIAEYLVAGQTMRIDIALRCKDCQIIEDFIDDSNETIETYNLRISEHILEKPLINLQEVNKSIK